MKVQRACPLGQGMTPCPAVHYYSLHPLALDRTIFPRCSKKSSQKPAKPLNSLEDLAHTIDERFVLAYPSQVVNTNVMNLVLTWEESLINLDYLLAWARPHLKLIKLNHSGCATVNSLNANPSGLNGELPHSSDPSQSEFKSEIGFIKLLGPFSWPIIVSDLVSIYFIIPYFPGLPLVPGILFKASIGKPYVDQSGQGTAQLLVGSSPGSPEIDDPKQGEQKPANLPSVNTGGLKSTLETLKLNPDPPKTTQVTQSGWEPTHLLNCKPELTSYSKTLQSPEDNSPNGHQIDANLEPPKIQTYAEVVACLKEVKTKPTVNSANDHQQLPVFCPGWVVQFNYSDDIVNSGSGTKNCHFYLPEQAQPGSAALKSLSQDPCPPSALSANLNPAKIEEAKTHDIKALAV
ncbi:hypothetical protein DSO57_1037371 [Entomophthora muscae]|uniref:Uncharacterized protein n=1 Tax=Entomophthora muscae TaxID=34485 RepID=A0ACC2RDU1_9FUNG|nr:hypothetical protein DSO57_1037371 [Entomophthora muscae]